MVKNRNYNATYKCINATVLIYFLIEPARQDLFLAKRTNLATNAWDHLSLRCADQANRFFE